MQVLSYWYGRHDAASIGGTWGQEAGALVASCSSCDSGEPTLQQKLVLKPSSFKVPDRNLETLRIQVLQALLDDTAWATACKQPGELARRALGPLHSFGAWQHVHAGARNKWEVVLECCARVSTDNKAGILGRSGHSGVFAAEVAKAGPKTQVEWMDCGETVGPAYLRLASDGLQKCCTVPKF